MPDAPAGVLYDSPLQPGRRAGTIGSVASVAMSVLAPRIVDRIDSLSPGYGLLVSAVLLSAIPISGLIRLHRLGSDRVERWGFVVALSAAVSVTIWPDATR